MLCSKNLDSFGVTRNQYEELVRHMSPDQEPAHIKEAEKKLGCFRRLKNRWFRKNQRKNAVKALSYHDIFLHENRIEQTRIVTKKQFTGCCGFLGGIKRLMAPKLDIEQLGRDQWLMDRYQMNSQMDLMKYVIEICESSLPAFMELKDYLLYKGDSIGNLHTHNLSQIGGGIWLVTYAIQFLIQPHFELDPATPEMIDIQNDLKEFHTLYEQMVKLHNNLMVDIESYHAKMQEARNYVIDIIKNIKKTYKNIPGNPFLVYGEKSPRRRKGKHRIFNQHSGTSDDDDETFEIQWTTLDVVFQRHDGDNWETFAFLPMKEKLVIFNSFINSVITYIETAHEEFRTASYSLTHQKDERLCIENPVFTTLAEITAATLDFTYFDASNTRKKDETQETYNNWSNILEDYWVAINKVYETTYDFMLLVHESRDAIHSCYKYCIIFYNWNLTPYEDFDARTSSKKYKKELEKTQKQIARVLGKKDYSEVAEYMALSDFTSSAYQEILRQDKFESSGRFLKFFIWEEPDENWGLVEDITGYDSDSDSDLIDTKKKNEKGEKQNPKEQKPKSKFEPKPKPVPKSGPKPGPSTKPAPQSKTKPGPTPKPKPKSEPKPAPKSEPKQGPSPKAVPKSVPKSGANNKSAPQSKTKPGPSPKLVPKSDPKPGPAFKAVPKPEPIPKPEPNPKPGQTSKPLTTPKPDGRQKNILAAPPTTPVRIPTPPPPAKTEIPLQPVVEPMLSTQPAVENFNQIPAIASTMMGWLKR